MPHAQSLSPAIVPDRVLELLSRLVAFDTTSRNSNLVLIEWVEAFLAGCSVASERFASDDGAKTNLFATLGGADGGPGVVLSGHTDVVPVDGQPWSSDPWTLTERQGRLYGRGAADMKAFLALSLAAVEAWTGPGRPAPSRPLHLAFSYDEEVGCVGVPRMVRAIAPRLVPGTAVLIGEPTEWKVVGAHKSIDTFVVEVTGLEAHSSRPDQGASAIMAALPLMQLVAGMAEQAREAGGPETSDLFDPPGATMTVGQVQGGTAVNILARTCTFLWDLRCPPGVDPAQFITRFDEAAAEVDQRLRRVDPACGVRVTRRSSTPALTEEAGGPADRLARLLTGDNARRAVGFATEGGVFQKHGLSAVVCGPGSIEQAHQPDEWIARDQIVQGCAVMDRLRQTLQA
jgi:acetylornithine deacetylase